MLKLKRVEIHGFKSFYDRTEMKFNGSGIAAVVGPNGCGKSNLSDAISWVLGEQSAKTLRGARMEDVIFAGTRDRKALGMASVTMTLVPDRSALRATPLIPAVRTAEEGSTPEPDQQAGAEQAHSQPVESADLPANGNGHGHHPAAPMPSAAAKAAEAAGEITITRRLYRSGESEYLINGKIARLRDIQDLFFGTGLGPESYAIIEQGRIGQILSNKPQDRRNVIEEAAGITKFKTRKRLAEAKLESAKQNLSRVFDILEEVTRQVNSLKRQAAKTKRYGELKSEATGYLRQLLASRYRQLERDMAKVAIELNLASGELAGAQETIGKREAGQETLLKDSYQMEQELTAAREVLAKLHVEAERARGSLEHQARQVEQISDRLTTGQAEAEGLARQESERAAELAGQREEFDRLEEEWAAVRAELDAKAAERQGAQARLTDQEQGLEARRQSVLRLLGEAAGLKNRITQIEAQLAGADRDAARARGDAQQSEADLTRIQKAKAQISEQLAARQTALISVRDQRSAMERDLQGYRAELAENRQALDRLKNEVSRLRARKDSLADVIQHRSYTTETVKRLFTAVERGKAEDFRPVGVLADFLEVDPQLEKAAEEFLHDELEFVVVSKWDDAGRGIELLRGDLNGRASFLVEEAGEETGEAPAVPCPPAADGLTKLTDALRWTNGLSSLPAHLIPRIAYCYVAEERGTARELAARFPHCWFLTRDGVNYHGGVVSGGRKSGAGPLALKRELREMTQLEQSKQRELAVAQDSLAKLEARIAAGGEQLERLRSQQQAQEKDLLALDHETRKLGEELQRVNARLSSARLELDRLGRDRVRLEAEWERARAVLGEREQSRLAEEQLLEAEREQLSGLRDELARTAEEHATLRANLASLDERRRALGVSRARLETQVRELQERRAHLAREHERLLGERARLVASNAELDAKSLELKEQTAAGASRVEHLAQAEQELRRRLAEFEEELKQLRAAAQLQQERKSESQVALARAEAELKHLKETCAHELSAELAEVAAGVEPLEDSEALARLEANHTEIRHKLEALGPVNPQALEEFEEAQQRQEFLTAQRQDLLDSIRDTENAIREIDVESRKRFGEAFEAINANFREMFKVLFGGGTGEMRLNDEDNLGESGIDIVASPPGKRLQSVLLLSGGEKSLTAMALLMSIFQYTPSPFCILDEVDAPLDEPNIERLTRLLKEMAEDTQFIVITHAKRTMEAAQSLYGVTMQEPGISKLVSVKFRPAADSGRPRTRTEEEERDELVAVTA